MAERVEPLDVWLYRRPLARLTQPNPGRIHYRLEFTEEALDTYGEGRRILSLALPISHKPVADAVGGPLPVTNFLEGLLPEGNLRQQLATALRVPTTDLMALLHAVGGDCAGAVQFLRAGAAPPEPTVRELTPDDVARIVADLPTYNLPDGALPHASLAGIQDKVLVADLGGGRWGIPQHGAASTHIIKPEPQQGTIPHLIQAEDWSLHVAAAAGLTAAQSRIETFDGRMAIVLTRYDRDPQGQRLHQEDFCQALGLPPQNKYEAPQESRSQGSRLSRLVARAVGQAAGDPTELRTALLRAVTYNVITGNGDAHSKNYSLLIGQRGEVSLAPLYDSAPVMFIAQRFRGTGHLINGKTSIMDVDAEDLIAEARTWGLPAKLAQRTVESTIDATGSAIADTATGVGLEQMRSNLDEFWTRKSWGSPSVGSEIPQSAPAPGQGDSEQVFVRGHQRGGRRVDDHWRQRPRR
ncbi:type II toxin-antitoxin system HipA family toxin [Mycobacterium sp.]|uniref:type II toxin-antitoxin system HipA family toxin n=1 Tax=Mycobacterium sp. TaxID=1785 RepID=UPI003A89B32C